MRIPVQEDAEREVYYAKGELKDIADTSVTRRIKIPQNNAVTRWGAWRRRLLSTSPEVQGEWIDEWM